MPFEAWFHKINRILIAFVGLGIEDLPDGPWADYHAAGMNPKQAIQAYAQDWDDTGQLAFLLDF